MALIRRIGFTRFDRWGTNLGRLHDVVTAEHTDALDGTDELKLTCSDDLTKGDRIVWVDFLGECHEHIVDECDRTHDDSVQTYTTATCINSIAELWDDWVDDKRPSGGVAVALTSILAGTRWAVGTCDQGGSASHTFYHVSAREALADLLDTWGGELETVVEHDGTGITSRAVGVRALRGNQSGAKRFTWTKDLLTVKRTVASDNPKTRVYGYGKGVETETGGYGRRLTFESVNGGKAYVEDAEAAQVWGHPDGAGGIAPSVTSYVNEQCEDAAQLLQETLDYLETVKEPKVTYTASVLDLYAFGRSWEGVGVGDSVAIIDNGFSDEGIRLKGRVSQIARDLLTGDATVTFGNLTDQMADMWQSAVQSLKSQGNKQALYDAVASASPGWLVQLQSALNAQFAAVGTYKIETFELGSIYSNVPLDETTGLPLKSTSGMWAVNINGRGIRLADGLASDGQWDWKTFITGSQVAADCINTGTMRAERVRAGLLTDETGENWWDLTNGSFSLSAKAEVGSGTIGDMVTATDVQYGLSDSASTQPTTWTTTAAWRQGKYLWQRVRMTLADGSITYSAAKMIASATGTGVASVVEQYYLSTSSTTQEGGYWSTTQQKWIKGRYYWTRSMIKWSDGTVTYTTPMLARALTSGNQSTDNLDAELDQTEVFNRLTNNGATQGIYLSNGKLYINASYIATGTITDTKGNNYWNLATGYLRTYSGLIGGLTIQQSYIGNTVFRLTNNGVHFYYSGYKVGMIGTNPYSGDSTKRGIVFDLENSGAYMTWACKDSDSASAYTMKFSYINNAFAGFTADTLALGCALDGRNYRAKNFWIDPNTGGADGGITATIRYVQVLDMNNDGTVARWGPNGKMQFKRGMLVDLTHY